MLMVREYQSEWPGMPVGVSLNKLCGLGLLCVACAYVRLWLG